VALQEYAAARKESGRTSRIIIHVDEITYKESNFGDMQGLRRKQK
jgi:hypothetical protein